MSSLNRVSLLGNIGQDPDIKNTNAGETIATLSVATSERWKDKNSGEQKEKTEWHRVVLFGNVAGIVEQYVRKGDRIYIEGQLRTRKWTDQGGNDRYTTEVVVSGFGGKVVLLGNRKNGGGDAEPEESGRAKQGGRSGTPKPESPGAYHDELDDEIPF